MKLFCMRVGASEEYFSVETQPHLTVEDLKALVIAKAKLKKKSYSTAEIELFPAKRDGHWLSGESEEVEALKRGDMEPIRDLLGEPLDAGTKVSNVFHDLPDRVLHVFVVEPAIAKKLRQFALSESAMLHSENRRKRWRALNKNLDAVVNKRMKTFSSSDHSSKEEEEAEHEMTDRAVWRQVYKTLGHERYEQKRKSIPDEHMDFLCRYLTDYVSVVMNRYDCSLGPKCSLFVVPMLSVVCQLFDDAKLEVDETVTGKDVHADARFEFVVTRGKTKKICVLVAKKDDFASGAAQAVVGCEAVADTTGVSVVYGIVTDFVQWNFYRCDEQSILYDSAVIEHDGGVPDPETIVSVCEKIYAILSDDDDEEKE